jgi:hypothetical protein
MAWVNGAPEHMAQLRLRVLKILPHAARFSQAAAAVNDLGGTEEEQKKTPTVELKTSRVLSTFINWTGTFLAGVGETLVLLYLLLASGDLFLQKSVRVMPTLRSRLLEEWTIATGSLILEMWDEIMPGIYKSRVHADWATENRFDVAPCRD